MLGMEVGGGGDVDGVDVWTLAQLFDTEVRLRLKGMLELLERLVVEIGSGGDLDVRVPEQRGDHHVPRCPQAGNGEPQDRRSLPRPLSHLSSSRPESPPPCPFLSSDRRRDQVPPIPTSPTLKGRDPHARLTCPCQPPRPAMAHGPTAPRSNPAAGCMAP